jgi:rsbT co-antagonist protein RsbR
MAETSRPALEQSLMHDMGLTDRNIERRQKVIDLNAEDLARIAELRPVIAPRVEEYTAVFFDYLGQLEEARGLLGNRDLLARARRLKNEHLLAMVDGNYGTAYVEQRLRSALIYSKAELETRVFLAAFHHLLRAIGTTVMKVDERSAPDAFARFLALQKLAFFDIGIIADVLVFERERIIRQQQEAIRELSTPVLQIRDRMLLLPIIGLIDTQRARMVTENLLRSIRANRAKVVVMDVTGVATVDSKVANHLLQTVTAARLMGARVIVTGLSSDVAQSLVALGIDVGKLNTVGDLQGGMEDAERLLGYRVVQTPDQATPAALT